MIIFETLKNVFNLVLPLALILNIFVYLPKELVKQSVDSTISSGNKVKINKERVIINTMIVIVEIMLVIGIIYLSFTRVRALSWIIVILAIPGYIDNFTDAYVSVGIIGTLINSDDNNKMSNRERNAITSFAYVIWFFGYLKFFDYIIDFLEGISNELLVDALQGIFYVVFSFIYIFLLCALMPVFFSAIFKGLKLIYKLLSKIEMINKLVAAVTDNRKIKVEYKLFLYKLMDLIKTSKYLKKIIGSLLFPIVFLIDVCLLFLTMVISIVFSGINDFFALLKMIKKSFSHIQKSISKITDKQIVAMSFRIATIVSLTAIVIENRYFPFFRNSEASTAVFEFIASAIIIPLIFEWIYSYRIRQTKINP